MALFSSINDAIGKVIGTDLVVSESGRGADGRTLVLIQCINCDNQRIVPWHRLNGGRPKRCDCKLALSEKYL